MKIAICGTRGIPNYYGGFEQFAEYLSLGLTQKGHQVYVYNSHHHPYQDVNWKGVNIIHCFDPEKKIGTAGQFIYDLNCIIDSRKRNFDIILQLGYTSSSIWFNLHPRESVIITNMDGLEWKRSKFSKKVQRFLKYAEKKAVRKSDYLVADSLGIQDYLKKHYNMEAAYIPYGANPFTDPDPAVIKRFDLQEFNYNMLIARLEPENNIEIILQGLTDADTHLPFLVIGRHTTAYGEYLKNKFTDKRINFLGPVYDLEILNNLRYYCVLYFHGHSVGGTNPSLLEAMASRALIGAHRNEFNYYILEEDAHYFSNSHDVKILLEKVTRENNSDKTDNNFQKVKTLYSWDKIIKDYETLMMDYLSKK